jgi:Type II secretion system (T2SS), protein E, N-terminal domain
VSTPLRERPDAPLGTLIFRAGLLPAETIESALEEGVKTGKRLGEILTERGLISEVDLARLLAGQKGLDFVTLREQIVDPSAATLFTEEQARLFRALPYSFEGELPVVAIADPTDEVLMRNIREALGRDDARFVVSARGELAEIAADVYAKALAAPAATPPAPAEEEPVTHVEQRNGHAPAEADLIAPPPALDHEPAAAPDEPAPFADEPQTEPEPELPPVPTDFDSPPEAPQAPLPDEPGAAEPFAAPEPEPVAAAEPEAEPPPLAESAPAPESVAPEAYEPPAAPEPFAALEPPLLPEPVAETPPPAPAPPPVEPLVEHEPLRMSEPELPPAPELAPEPAFVSEPPAALEPPAAAEPVPLPQPPAPPPAPYPPAAVEPEPAPDVVEPPAEQPAPWRMTIRLTNGERVEAGDFPDQAAAKLEARTIMGQIADADSDEWPFVNGRFLKPDTIVSVDIAELSGDDD